MPSSVSRPDILLFNLKDISSHKIPEIYLPYTSELSLFSGWVTNFLAQSNIDLGRTGAVCPYVQYAEEKGFFKVGIFDEPNPKQDFVIELIRNLKDIFIAMLPTTKKDQKFKAITILFPTLHPDQVIEIIDGVQLFLKPEFVKQGLMIGQFYENCEQGGLRNSNFRPLQSPVPLLAIRNMVETDWPFLEGDEILEKAYKDNFGTINFGAKVNY
ncbi:DUF6875 domain-containing protein [Pedobacter sp. L105]|uniref:DUF6875 domain-containing protein n=1 Tax=Pedobacter sp. L105 TaxID=1641871 RepID=UPI00131A97AD|nr:hypothetical protein [Pedobacter sp. L105]